LKKTRTKAYLMLISAMLIFGTIGVFRRSIPLSSGLLAFSRGLLGSLFLLFVTRIRGKRIRHGVQPKKSLLLVLSGAIIGVNWMLLFEAYNYATVATVTLCYYMAPTFIVLLSPFVLKERMTPKKGICALVAIVGMAFVSGVIGRTSDEYGDYRGVLLSISAAVLYAAVVLLNKRFLSDVEPMEKTSIQLFSAAVIMIPYLLLTEDFTAIPFSLPVLGLTLFVGIVHTGLSYLLYFGSMNELPAQSVAILSYIDPITAFLLSAVFLREPVTVYSVVGAVLILGSALVAELSIGRKKES